MNKTFWVHNEVDFTADIQDYKVNLTDIQRTIFTRSILSIAQTEVCVKPFWVISYGNESVKNQVTLPDDAPPVEPSEPSPSVAPMNFTFFKVNPNCLNPIFAVDVDSDMNTDQFLCSSFFDVKAVRNLDIDGLPY